MERVEFQQEQMLAELKDMEEKGLFSKGEIKIIMKKRTAFEAALVRRIPKKSDFLQYVEYEMGLEVLRRRRVRRLEVKDTMPSISDYALVRRQFHIFERALRKFKADVRLWVQYIELAKREGARALMGRISARALQLHPNEPSLYIYAAQHELSNMSPAAARALLQRGLRLNQDSELLWTEYVKFELGFVESLRKRWEVLGVGSGAEEDSEEARKTILQGAIVRAVVEEAVKAKPTMALFRALFELLYGYPTPLRSSLLEHLDGLLTDTLPKDPEALKLRARWLLPAQVEETEEFVEQLRKGNGLLLTQARTQRGAVSKAYAEVVAEWCNKPDLEPSLREYLVACLQSLTGLQGVSGTVLAMHVRLLCEGAVGLGLGAAVGRARMYTARLKGDGEVWLARLDAERLAGTTGEEIGRIWSEARRAVQGDGAEEDLIWRWRLDDGDDAVYEDLLRESLRLNKPRIHRQLALHYVAHRLPDTRLSRMTRVLTWCAIDRDFCAAVFIQEVARTDVSRAILAKVYDAWQSRNGNPEAGLAWARWLFSHGESALAAEVIGRTRGAEREWASILDNVG